VRKRPGRLPSLGHDFDAGHRGYVEKVGSGGERWLYTKPFSVPPSDELARCLHSFAHVVERLNLGVRAQILDVGCGPGWMSEWFARCGYWVTGVDISEDMIRIAQERVSAIEDEIAEGLHVQAEFHALPVREMPWENRFDAAVLFDTLHHFDDELETLRVIHRTLAPGGRIYIEEGVRPPPGSEAERNLVTEMREYGTLESPFDPEYLVEVLEQAGFEGITRFAVADELYDLEHPKEAVRGLQHQLRYPHLNSVLAAKRLEAGTGSFKALIQWNQSWEERNGELVTWVTVTNEGQSYWPVGRRFPFPAGTVTIGPYLLGESDERVELPRGVLPFAVPPGGAAPVPLFVPRQAVEGAERVLVDLVREGLNWFSELGSEVVELPLPR
jgi:SAM-dependent methyltransferase